MEFKTRFSQKISPFKELMNQEWLLFLTFAILMASFGIGLTNPILSLYGSTFTESRFKVGIFMTMFAFGRVVATIPATYIATRWGYMRIMVLGLLIKTVGAVGVALAQSYTLLIPPRFLEGIGDALLMSSGLLAVITGSQPGNRGMSISLFQTGAFLGLALSPSLGGKLASSYGLRMPIYVQAVLSLLIALIVWHLSRKIHLPIHQKEVASGGNPDDVNQSAARNSVNSSFLLVAFAAFLIFVARAGVRDTLLPIYANDQIGLGPVEIGILFNIFAFSNLGCIPVSGYFTDRIGRKLVVGGGLLLIGIGILVTGFSNSYTWLCVGVVAMACGKGLSEPATVVYLSDITPNKRMSLSFGLFLTLRDLGLMLGPVMLGAIADLYGLKAPFIVTAITCGICVFWFMLVAQEKKSFGFALLDKQN